MAWLRHCNIGIVTLCWSIVDSHWCEVLYRPGHIDTQLERQWQIVNYYHQFHSSTLTEDSNHFLLKTNFPHMDL